jgi:hypothetical protein
LCARLIIVAVRNTQAAVCRPFMGTDFPHAGAGVVGAEVAVVALAIIVVAAVQNRFDVAKSEVGTCQGALILRAHFAIIAVGCFMAAIGHGVVEAGVVDAAIGGAAVAVFAVSVDHTAAGARRLELAQAVSAEVLGAVVLICALAVQVTALEARNWCEGAGVVGAGIQGARELVVALKISHTAVGIR